MDTRGQKNFNTDPNKMAARRLIPVQESPSKILRRSCLSSVAGAFVFSGIYTAHAWLDPYQISLLRNHRFTLYNPNSSAGQGKNSILERSPPNGATSWPNNKQADHPIKQHGHTVRWLSERPAGALFFQVAFHRLVLRFVDVTAGIALFEYLNCTVCAAGI